jgi:UDPglucose 6-dehydrogenase
MKIGIIGVGVVGQAIKSNFEAKGVLVICYDKNSESLYSYNDLLTTESIFLCVPTPTVDNHCDISIIKECIDRLNNEKYTGLIIIKSTVIIGTTQQLINQYPELRICFIPEFLRQDHAAEDFINNQELIVGTNSLDDYALVCQIHQYFITSSFKITPTEAELTKYFSNTFNALRVVFANAFYSVCENVGADYQAVLKSAMARPSNAVSCYLQCNNDLKGFAGACLPKDLQAFSTFVEQAGLPIKLFETIINDNTYYKK